MPSDTKLIKYLTGQLPNTRAIPIAEFCLVLENNLGFTRNLREYRHLVGSFAYDYKRLFQELSDDEKIVIAHYLGFKVEIGKTKRKWFDF